MMYNICKIGHVNKGLNLSLTQGKQNLKDTPLPLSFSASSFFSSACFCKSATSV